MPRFSKFLLGAFVAAAVVAVFQVGGGARPAEALTNCTVSDSFDSEEQAFLALINNYRAQNGRAALTASVNLNRASAWMAKDMATKNYFSHTDSLGRSAGTRIANCDGLPYNGENIAAGTVKDTAAEAFEMWRNSSGHNANMLNSSYRQIGIARAYVSTSTYSWYWVTDFSTTNDGTNAGGSSTGGGASTATATPRPSSTATATPRPATATPAPTSTKATMTSPTNGATLTTSQTFRWTTVSGAQQYYFYMGTSPGTNNMVSYSTGLGTQLTVSGFPTTGATVYVRLWTRTASGWQYNDYSYRLPQ
jgi:hypothetical protein